MKERRLRRVEIFRRRVGRQRAAAEGDDAAAEIGDRKHHAVAEAVVGHRDVVAGDQQAGLDHVLDADALPAEMLLQRKALARRVAEAEFQLRRANRGCGRRDSRAPWRRRGRPSVASKNFAASSMTSWSVLRFSSRASSSLENFGSGMPAICAEPLDGLRERARPRSASRSRRCSPFLPEEKSNQACFWSLTKNDGVFSLLNGDRPFHSRPDFCNFTRRPTTSETGRRALQLVEELRRKAHVCGRLGWAESVARPGHHSPQMGRDSERVKTAGNYVWKDRPFPTYPQTVHHPRGGNTRWLRPHRKTFVLVHGAWHGGWCWRRVSDLLERQGHKVFTPTLTGLGERSHLLRDGHRRQHPRHRRGQPDEMGGPRRRGAVRPLLRRHGGVGRRRADRPARSARSCSSTPSCRTTATRWPT